MTVEQFSKSLDINPDKIRTAIFNIFKNFKKQFNIEINYIDTYCYNNKVCIQYTFNNNLFNVLSYDVDIITLFKEYRKEKLKSLK